MGAFIVQREPFEDRRKMLEIGIAGPIAGLLLAVPLYIVGMHLSAVKVIPKVLPEGFTLVNFGNSLFTQAVQQMVFGVIDPASGRAIFEHPVALGAWVGLLVTAMNLLPAGQLDGGHVANALLGEKSKYLSYVVIAACVVMTQYSISWLIWGGLLFLMGRSHPPALNQATLLKPWRSPRSASSS
jgi:membrane-associated protease RseP (regulator of RpoE activity)